MCNMCHCEMSDRCSIIGNIPIGFCCEKCDYYVEGTACDRLKIKVSEKLPESFRAIFSEKHIFPERFCLKQKINQTIDEF